MGKLTRLLKVCAGAAIAVAAQTRQTQPHCPNLVI
jgi:hypothetical protein